MFKSLKHMFKALELLYTALGQVFQALGYKFPLGKIFFLFDENNSFLRQKKMSER